MCPKFSRPQPLKVSVTHTPYPEEQSNSLDGGVINVQTSACVCARVCLGATTHARHQPARLQNPVLQPTSCDTRAHKPVPKKLALRPMHHALLNTLQQQQQQCGTHLTATACCTAHIAHLAAPIPPENTAGAHTHTRSTSPAAAHVKNHPPTQRATTRLAQPAAVPVSHLLTACCCRSQLLSVAYSTAASVSCSTAVSCSQHSCCRSLTACCCLRRCWCLQPAPCPS